MCFLLAQMVALMAAITPIKVPKEDLSEEQLAEFEARAKEFSRMKARRVPSLPRRLSSSRPALSLKRLTHF